MSVVPRLDQLRTYVLALKQHDKRTRKRRAADATTAALHHDAQVKRPSLLERELDLQRRTKDVCEAITTPL